MCCQLNLIPLYLVCLFSFCLFLRFCQWVFCSLILIYLSIVFFIFLLTVIHWAWICGFIYFFIRFQRGLFWGLYDFFLSIIEKVYYDSQHDYEFISPYPLTFCFFYLEFVIKIMLLAYAKFNIALPGGLNLLKCEGPSLWQVMSFALKPIIPSINITFHFHWIIFLFCYFQPCAVCFRYLVYIIYIHIYMHICVSISDLVFLTFKLDH